MGLLSNAEWLFLAVKMETTRVGLRSVRRKDPAFRSRAEWRTRPARAADRANKYVFALSPEQVPFFPGYKWKGRERRLEGGRGSRERLVVRRIRHPPIFVPQLVGSENQRRPSPQGRPTVHDWHLSPSYTFGDDPTKSQLQVDR